MNYLGIGGEESMVWLYQKSKFPKNTQLIAWIHSHVRGALCGFSSIDVHTQYGYSRLFEGTIGVVVEINDEGVCQDFDYFVLSKHGHEKVGQCGRSRNCSSIQHELCSDRDFFQSIKNDVILASELKLESVNFMIPALYDNEQFCMICQKSFKSILSHLSRSKNCKTKLGQKRFSELQQKSAEK